MNIILIQNAANIEAAAAIALDNHIALRRARPYLPARELGDFIPRIEWMTKEGTVYGLESENTLLAFLGWFPLDNLRNLGSGALTPDWCLGVRSGDVDHKRSARETSRLISPLFRKLIEDIKRAGLSVHAVGVPASEAALLDECGFLGYGRIVLDAARPTADLLAEIPSTATTTPTRSSTSPTATQCVGEPRDVNVRQATKADAPDLARLDERLARHIGASPVCMPDAKGSTIAEWEAWLDEPGTVTFVAEGCIAGERRPVGFIKADRPHFDVSWFVHGESTLAICGLFVEEAWRGRRVDGVESGEAARYPGGAIGPSLGACLVRAIAEHAAARGCALVSVDCETHNPEARAFWLSRFEPVSWSFERRF